LTYLNHRPDTSQHPRLRLSGTAHDGPQWTSTARLLRVAVENALELARPRRSASVNTLGAAILDGITELSGSELHVLQVCFSTLMRLHRRSV
jgi:hypothetical protein